MNAQTSADYRCAISSTYDKAATYANVCTAQCFVAIDSLSAGFVFFVCGSFILFKTIFVRNTPYSNRFITRVFNWVFPKHTRCIQIDTHQLSSISYHNSIKKMNGKKIVPRSINQQPPAHTNKLKLLIRILPNSRYIKQVHSCSLSSHRSFFVYRPFSKCLLFVLDRCQFCCSNDSINGTHATHSNPIGLAYRRELVALHCFSVSSISVFSSHVSSRHS